MRRFFMTLGFLAAAGTALAFGKPEHSSVEVETKGTPDGKEFVVRVKANANMTVTFDAPWKLQIKGHDGLTLAKTTFGKEEMDEALPGFIVKAKADKPQGVLEYDLTAFICTKDKTQCFREVHKGKHDWTK